MRRHRRYTADDGRACQQIGERVGTGEGIGSAAGCSDGGEPSNLLLSGEVAHVVSPVEQTTIRLRRAQPHAGAVEGIEMDAEFCQNGFIWVA